MNVLQRAAALGVPKRILWLTDEIVLRTIAAVITIIAATGGEQRRAGRGAAG
jgi:hypothetical protein